MLSLHRLDVPGQVGTHGGASLSLRRREGENGEGVGGWEWEEKRGEGGCDQDVKWIN